MKLLLKHLKKILAALFLGFLAFAPPGTLIIIAILILGIFGKTWFIAGIILGSLLLAVYGYVFRNKLLNSRISKKIIRKLKIKPPDE